MHLFRIQFLSRSENRFQQKHTTDDLFDIVLGRAMVQGGIAKSGGPVQLHMTEYELNELKKDYKDVFRDEIRKRLTRDTDYSKETARFATLKKEFM